MLREENCGHCLGAGFGQLCGCGFSPCLLFASFVLSRESAGMFFHELRFEGSFLPEPIPTLLWGCRLCVHGRISKAPLSCCAGKTSVFPVSGVQRLQTAKEIL